MRPDDTILLVEDDDVNAFAVKKALKELGISNSLKRARNGEEALRNLREHPDQVTHLILVDLNMPIMGGIEFLQEIKRDPQLKIVPVVVLTTSDQDTDKRNSFQNGAAGYMVKPPDYNRLLDIMRIISTYWSTSEVAVPRAGGTT